MDLSRSRDAFGRPTFAATLADQLREQRAALPVERACLAGGWPTDLQVVSVGDGIDTGEAIRAEVTVSFVELITGCAGSPLESPRLLFGRVCIQKTDGRGRFDVDESVAEDV